ncbi:beta-lactamase [Colletotrichum plurivorum]|uniref:Beta-lactamase n=1 Tax=Colletotrichum plurivorum TaxID=2175906 RepID=A0A8H6NE77_9PEZI|nr:beta-lactamase [Colletotrichum plurivorum]
MPLSSQTVDELRCVVNNATSDPHTIPGTTVVVVDRSGAEHFAHSSGKRGISSSEPMGLENVFWIASCTKMVAGIACMQLVEQGVLKLDDSDHLEKLCPELADIKVLNAEGKLEEKKRGITLRMLLTHTAGFAYTFFNNRLREWSLPAGVDEFSGSIRDMMAPLIFQPGEGWEYGTGIDWAGIALERATNTTLNAYIQENICQPLGLKNVNMFPTPSMKENLAFMHYKRPDGTVIPRDHPLHRPLIVQTDEEITSCFNSGGAGLFAKPQEYASKKHVPRKILAVLLNDGTCPITKSQILKKETVDEMFKNQVPQHSDFNTYGLEDSKPELSNKIPMLKPSTAPQGWGLTFMLSSGLATGVPDGSADWAGLPNLFWWCDRKNGVAGMVCSQILPFGDPAVLGLMADVQTAVYKGLKEAA